LDYFAELISVAIVALIFVNQRVALLLKTELELNSTAVNPFSGNCVAKMDFLF